MNDKTNLSGALDNDALTLIKHHTGCNENAANALVADLKTLFGGKAVGSNLKPQHFRTGHRAKTKTDC